MSREIFISFKVRALRVSVCPTLHETMTMREQSCCVELMLENERDVAENRFAVQFPSASVRRATMEEWTAATEQLRLASSQ